jgi:signal transduction histidine kinase
MIKILAIDDNKDNLIVLQALLSDAFPDSKILSVQSGAEGILVALTENPDVILLDLVMPGMDGFETCRKLKQDNFLRRIPVIILTAAKTETASRIKALKLGAEAFLGKPIDESELAAQVSSMVRIKKSEDTVRLENLRLEEVVKERTIDLLKELEERKRTEAELKKSYEELDLSKRATLNLLEDLKLEMDQRHRVQSELILAKEKAEASDRLKTAFMNNISHEVRTPLNGILGFGELIIAPDLTEEDKELYFRILQSSSNRLLKTISDYMEISLIVSGNMEVCPSLFQPDDLLDGIFESFYPHAKAKNLEMIVSKTENAKGFILHSDPELISKLIINLVDNAIKYSDHGTIEIGYLTLPGVVQFFVRDNGIGISEDKQVQIFEYFMREDETHTRKFEGSGLGLSIAKGLVELLGGKIWVESEKGVGSTFWFTVPRI